MPAHLIELGGLFGAAFLSASFVPFQSELIFAAMIASGHYDNVTLLVVASAGNTLGAALNWWVGTSLTKFEGRKWFPVRKAHLVVAERWFRRYGKWTLLFAWLPVIGDPLTVIAGVLKMRFLPFLCLTAIGKSVRYILLLAAFH